MMEKSTSEGLVFSFTKWKLCTIQGSSISDDPHCPKWQLAQSCAAVSLLSTTNLPDLKCDQIAWPAPHHSPITLHVICFIL